MENLTKSNFESKVGGAIVFVDFWADWCGPCRALAPIYESVANKFQDKAVFMKCNVDEEQMIAVKQGIISIPCIIAFSEGKAIDKFVGLTNEAGLTAFIQKHIK